MNGRPEILLCLFALLICTCTAAQDSVAVIGRSMEEKYAASVESRLHQFMRQTDKHTRKLLDRITRQEKNMQRTVAKMDAVLAVKLFSYSIDSLQQFKNRITGRLARVQKYTHSYFPYIDTLKQSLKFLGEAKDIPGQASKLQNRLQSSLDAVNRMEASLGNIENMEGYMARRQEVLQQQLKQFPQLADNLKRINKQAYYYSAQINQYKEDLKNPSRIEGAVLQAIKKLPAFQQLVQRNAALSGILALPASFPLSANGASTPVVNGLPSRTSLQAFVQSNVPTGKRLNPAGQIIQQLPDIKPQSAGLKNRINKTGGMGSGQLADFKPNSQRTKSVWKRLEYGTDLQFGRGVRYLPATAALAAKLGYRLNDKSTAGTGISYMLGMGQGWKNIRFSTQAIGLRTYLTWKLSKGLDVQGGAEWNCLFHTPDAVLLKRPDAWQQSALLGLNKQYKAGKKIKGNIQVLYDFLYNRHFPATQPIVFRFGYSL